MAWAGSTVRRPPTSELENHVSKPKPPVWRRRSRPKKGEEQEKTKGLMTVRTFLITTVAVGAGAGLVVAGQPWLAIPATVGVLGGLHAIVG